jgi:quinol monooxygenase YgiN
MYVQIISIKAPLGQVNQLRAFVDEEFIPSIKLANGFISANMLEQVDDRDSVKLIVYWESQKAVENANSTGLLLGSDSSLTARLPGVRIQRQSYIMQASTEGEAQS